MIATRKLALTTLFAAVCLMGCNSAAHALIPPPAVDTPLTATHGRQTAVFAGGCFWGQQAVFQRVKGVLATTAGYDGGTAATATYDQVTTETTRHAESVKVVFDPARITYGKLLQIFFSVHDPTTLNRQGPDVGTSYRSTIFYNSKDQQRIATAYIAQLNAAHAFPRPIVTQVVSNSGFYDAESYHQDYAYHNPDNPYIEVCDRPKIATLKADFPDLYMEYTPK
jgi:peptide-methionine (S)-S-oxide reductase